MKKYKITVRGTGQLNGPVSINKSFVTDDARLAQSFTGSNRYEVMAAWVKNAYPGVRISNIRSFGANVISFDEKKEGEESSSWWKLW